MTRPDFFIVGEPKCGTTALYEAIRQHPDVFMPDFKEPHHFSTDLWHHHGGDAYRRVASREGYLALFRDAGQAKAVGESSVHYLYSTVAAEEIARFNPDARIIAMFRKPADYLHSLHNQNIVIGHEPIRDFATALDATLDDRRAAGLREISRFNYGWTYDRATRFAEHLARYQARFAPSQLKVVLFDDLAADMDGVVADVFGFLGVDPSFRPAPADRNPAREVSRPAAMSLLWSEHPLRRAAARAIPLPLRRRLYDRITRLGTRVQPRSPMDPALRARLVARYRPEVEALEAAIGRDLSSWKVA